MHVAILKTHPKKGRNFIMNNGTLQVKVTTSEGTVPVSGAHVKIGDAFGHIVHTLTTDINGLTAPVKLFAPGKNLSLSPLTSERAYSLYQVLVTEQGYVPQVVRGLRVFDGEAILLPVDLVLHSADSDLGDFINVVEIPPLGVTQRAELTPLSATPNGMTSNGVTKWAEFPPPNGTRRI